MLYLRCFEANRRENFAQMKNSTSERNRTQEIPPREGDDLNRRRLAQRPLEGNASLNFLVRICPDEPCLPCPSRVGEIPEAGELRPTPEAIDYPYRDRKFGNPKQQVLTSAL
jgi:hypothetical protein